MPILSITFFTLSGTINPKAASPIWLASNRFSAAAALTPLSDRKHVGRLAARAKKNPARKCSLDGTVNLTKYRSKCGIWRHDPICPWSSLSPPPISSRSGVVHGSFSGLS